MLSGEQLDKVEMMLAGAGWLQVAKPLLEARQKAVRAAYRLLPHERPGPMKVLNDEAYINLLRGRDLELEWFLAAFENELKAARHNRNLDELEARSNGAANP